MLRDLLSATLCVALVASSAGIMPASAQTLAQIGGPAETPPAGFKGDQFVDSRGCIFMRAGVGGSTNWIPRVGANHKVLCGYPPTFGPRERVAAVPDAPAVAAPTVAAAAPAPAAKPAPAAAPTPVVVADATPGCPPNAPYGRLETRADGRDVLKCFSRKSAAAAPAPAPVVVAAKPAPAPAPAPAVAAARPAAVTKPAPVAVASAPAAAATAQGVPARVISSGGPGPGQVACPASMPVLVRVKLTTGGTALLCSPGTQPIVVAAAPTYPPGSGLAPSISPATGASTRSTGAATTRAATTRAATTRATAPATQVASAEAMPPLPPGYKRAWKDDRLNPYRGQGTAQGWAQQDRLWTRTVPAQPVVATKPYVPPPAEAAVTVSTRAAKAAPVQPRVTVSTRSAPQAAAGGTTYVQIGSFGVPANASGAAGKLSALGLPVATTKTTRNGKSLQIVLAGPFASTAEAQRALSTARGAGFGDAFIR